MKLKIFLPALFAAILFAGCNGRYAQPPAYSGFEVNLKVPFHRQASDSLCGLAAIEMIADFYGKTLEAKSYATLKIGAEITGGLKAGSLKKCLEASGFEVAVFPGTLDRKKTGIYYHLDKKRPLLVLISENQGTAGHYLVLAGYNKDSKLLSFVNPSRGADIAPLTWFEPLWKNGDYLTLLAIPKE